MTDSDSSESVDKRRELLEEIAQYDLPIARHAQKILDNLEDRNKDS